MRQTFHPRDKTDVMVAFFLASGLAMMVTFPENPRLSVKAGLRATKICGNKPARLR